MQELLQQITLIFTLRIRIFAKVQISTKTMCIVNMDIRKPQKSSFLSDPATKRGGEGLTT